MTRLDELMNTFTSYIVDELVGIFTNPGILLLMMICVVLWTGIKALERSEAE